MSVELLETAAKALDALRDRVVFLGGATVALWITDPAGRGPRVTLDVDVVAEVVGLTEYEAFQAQLRQHGFAEDVESGVICRWCHAQTGLILDAVPLESRLAGFGGRWLAPAVTAAVEHGLPSGATIRVVPPIELLATKLEAFADRGHNDCLASRDFEDVVLLIDSREELASELRRAPAQLEAYVRDELTRVHDLPTFEYGIVGALSGSGAPDRARAVTLPRWRQLAEA